MDNDICIKCKKKLIINLNFSYRYVCSNECLKSLNKCAPKCKYFKCPNKTIFLNKKGRYAMYCSLTCRKSNSEGLDKCLACNKETMKSLKSGEHYSFCSIKCRIENSPKCMYCNNLVNYDRVNKKFFIMCPECYKIKNTQIINKNCDIYIQNTIMNDGTIFENNNQLNVNIITQSSQTIPSLHECQILTPNVTTFHENETHNEHSTSDSKISPFVNSNDSCINENVFNQDKSSHPQYAGRLFLSKAQEQGHRVSSDNLSRSDRLSRRLRWNASHSGSSPRGLTLSPLWCLPIIYREAIDYLGGREKIHNIPVDSPSIYSESFDYLRDSDEMQNTSSVPNLNTKKYYHFFANNQLSDNSKYYQKCCYIYCPNMLEVNEHTDVFFSYCQDCKKSKNYQYDS